MVKNIIVVLNGYCNSPSKYIEIYKEASKVAAVHDIGITDATFTVQTATR